eukprot:649492-Lingulodinium_polyedra.AAC.1
MVACCGASKPALDAIGRWKASGSAEYVRTARALVSQAQHTIAERALSSRGEGDIFGEEDVLEKF